MAFVEDSLLTGFLLTRTVKLKADAIAYMKEQTETEAKSMDREQLARQLIGPRGGLPTLKDIQGRFDSSGSLAACGGREQRHCAEAAEEGASNGSVADGQESTSNIDCNATKFSTSDLTEGTFSC